MFPITIYSVQHDAKGCLSVSPRLGRLWPRHTRRWTSLTYFTFFKLIDVTKVFDCDCIASAHWGTILWTGSRSRVVQLVLQATCLSCPSINPKAQREQRWKPALLWRSLSRWLRSFQGIEWSSEFYYYDNQNMFYVIILSNRTQQHLSIIFV